VLKNLTIFQKVVFSELHQVKEMTDRSLLPALTVFAFANSCISTFCDYKIFIFFYYFCCRRVFV